MSSHNGPSGQIQGEPSHDETSYVSYTNQGQHVSGRGIINNINNINNRTTNYQRSTTNPLGRDFEIWALGISCIN